jgi:peroxiredoxin
LPGAFTPTCSSQQLPGFENNCEQFKKLGIDEVYCCSVNDAYTMNAWSEKMQIKNVKLIPDGNGNFTKQMGMLISKDHLGFGNRSWRYMAVITDGIVEKWWEEPGINNDGSDDDPYGETMPEKCLEYLSWKLRVISFSKQILRYKIPNMFRYLNIWFISSLLVSIFVIIPILTVFMSFFENTSIIMNY